MTESFDFLEEITKRYGTIKRARGCFLYTQSGERITDLWLDGGRAVLGWSAGTARMHFKNSIDRGFTGFCSSALPANLKRALSSLCSGFAFFAFYTDSAKVTDALCSAGLKGAAPLYLPWVDYGFDLKAMPHSKIKKDAPFYTDESLKERKNLLQNADCVEIVLPFSWRPATLLAFRNAELHAKVPASDGIPAPLCEAFCRAIYDLRLEIPKRAAEDWAVFDKFCTPYWNRIGPYLCCKVSESQYKDFFMHCLDQKLLIAPSFGQYSVVPFGANDGVFAGLKKNPFALC